MPLRSVKALAVNLVVSLVTVFFLFLLIELTFRTIIFFENQKSFAKLMRNLEQPENGIAKHLGQIIQPSRYPSIVYELRPNLSVYFRNAWTQTNKQGFRMGPLSLEKGKRTVRIVGLGDSHMFGWAVSQEEMYAKLLENILNAKFPQKKWEFINTGVPGYNTFVEVETLSRKALIYKPDIVIYEFIANDFDVPFFLLEAPDCLSFKRSFFIDFLKNKLKEEAVRIIQEPMKLDGMPEDDIRKIPERYRYMFGMQAFLKSMIKLKKMQERNHFEVVICFSQSPWPQPFDALVALCQRLGFHVLIDVQNDPSLISDGHPTAVGHKLKAEAISEFMSSEKIIDKYLSV